MSASQTMRAVVFDGPATDVTTTRVTTLPIPEPGPGMVSIEVTHAGINFKDVMARRGDTGYVSAWPFVPGLEVAGSVRALGDGVSDLHVGEPVVAFTGAGGLAEIALADARLTLPLPEGLSGEEAAAAPGALLSSALLIDEVGRMRAGETLLVHSAAGGVGSASAQLARVSGAALLLGTVGNAARAESARRNGYDIVLAREPGLGAAVRAATGGRGVDLILDPQGTTLLEVDLEMIASGGRILLFGNATGARFEPLPPLSRLMATNVSLAGFSLAALAASEPTRVATALTRVLNQLAAGVIQLEIAVLDGLEAAQTAQQRLADGEGHTKSVIKLTM